uniref:Uncharacterized protein n=1 Tax=Varanus komodoensis TaxID=61221 RepID=A0A8D2L696_VARKO
MGTQRLWQTLSGRRRRGQQGRPPARRAHPRQRGAGSGPLRPRRAGTGPRAPQFSRSQACSGPLTQADSWCLLRYDLSAKVFSQRLQRKCLKAECVCMWARRLERSAKALPQCAQPKGFSPSRQAHLGGGSQAL